MTVLLISCDVFWEKENYDEFDTVYFSRNLVDVPREVLAAVSHWIVDPAPEKKITDQSIAGMKSLQVIASPSTGTTHISIQNEDIKILCLRDIEESQLATITASSEYTFLLFLSLVKNFKKVLGADLKHWRNDLKAFRGRQLNQMKIAIFGVGRIGANLSRYLEAFGASVYYYDPEKTIVGRAKKLSLCQIKDQMNEFDAVFVCFHASDDNFEFVSRNILQSMKQDSYFINTSRGENVAEQALCDLIQEGHFAGVGLDVLQNEQAGGFDKRAIVQITRSHPNAIITPHVAGVSSDSEKLAFDYIYNLMVNS